MILQYDQLRSELIKEFGLEVLTAEKQEEMLSKMMEALMKKIFVDTMERLGETGMDEYETFLAKEPDESEIEVFLNAKIPEYDVMVGKIVADFKKEMKGSE